jgi:hypothetical protein
MSRVIVLALLSLGLVGTLTAQDAPDNPPAADDGPPGKRRGRDREDGASPEALKNLTDLEQRLADKLDDKGLLAAYLGSSARPPARPSDPRAGNLPKR